MDDSTPEQIALQSEGMELEKGIASIQYPELRARALWKRNIEERVYPAPDRVLQAARALADARPRVLALIEVGDYSGVIRLLGEVDEQCRRLAIPERNLSYEELLQNRPEGQGVGRRLSELGWMSEEQDSLKLFWREGDRFTEVGISSVKFNDRTVLRSDVRKRLREGARETSERNEREALLLEAENNGRRLRNEPAYHRNW